MHIILQAHIVETFFIHSSNHDSYLVGSETNTSDFNDTLKEFSQASLLTFQICFSSAIKLIPCWISMAKGTFTLIYVI